jgi:hypothetical protein
MRECGWIEKDEIDLAACRMNAFQQVVLGIALVGLKAVTEALGLLPEKGLDVAQGLVTVDFGLTCTEQAQVRAIQEQEVCHKATLAKSPRFCAFSLEIAAQYGM